jgi:predicted DNA-binding transcriptional regulator YafY
MKSNRLLSALMLLQAYGRLSTRELAQRLEVSQRTAHRDMEALSVAGIPIFALRGAKGGWELEKGWRTKVPALDEAELRALLMAQPSALGNLRLAASAERAFDKLVAAMPGSMRSQVDSIRARLYIDPTGWHPSAEDLSLLPAVQDAVTRDLKLTFLYTRRDGQTAPRTVDPLGVVCKQAIWYLVARTPTGMRTYRISRMANAVVLATPFLRPENFDLGRHWKASVQQLNQMRTQYIATLALAPEAAASLNRWCPISPLRAAPHNLNIPVDWVICSAEFECISQARFVVLGFGPRVHVLEPAELCDCIRSDRNALIQHLADAPISFATHR